MAQLPAGTRRLIERKLAQLARTPREAVNVKPAQVGVRNEPQRFGVRVMLGFLRHPNLRALREAFKERAGSGGGHAAMLKDKRLMWQRAVSGAQEVKA